MKNYAIGPLAAYENYKLSTGYYYNGVDSTGFLDSSYTMQSGDSVEITFRIADTRQQTELIDGDAGANNAYIAYLADGTIINTGFTNIKIDGQAIGVLPNDDDEHTITADYDNSAMNVIYTIGSTFGGFIPLEGTFLDFKINSVSQNVNFTNVLEVGGQGDDFPNKIDIDDRWDTYALASLDSVYSGVITDDYYTFSISEITENTCSNFNYNNSTFTSEFDGKDYLLNDNCNTYTLPTSILGGETRLHNFNIKSLINKDNTVVSIFQISTNDTGDFYIYNNKINLNSKSSNFLFIGSHQTDDINIYNNIVYNGENSGYGGIRIQGTQTGNCYIDGNSFVGLVIGIFNITFPQNNLFISNSYFDGNSSGLSGLFTDSGGIRTSDSTAPESQYKNISSASAFIDLIDFLPIVDGPLKGSVTPIITERTNYYNGPLIPIIQSEIYSGANGYLQFNEISGSSEDINEISSGIIQGAFVTILGVSLDSNETSSGFIIAPRNPLTDILNQMEIIIENMSQETGYFFNWGTADEWDETKMNSFPSAYIDFVEEENGDFRGTGACVNSMINTARVRIRLYAKLDREPDKPIKTIRNLSLNLSTDIKKAFNENTNSTLNNTCNHIHYVSTTPFYPSSNLVLKPGYMEMIYDVVYEQSVENPKNRR